MKFRILTIIAMVFLSFSAAAFGANPIIDGRWSGRYGTGIRGINYDQTFCTDTNKTRCFDNPQPRFMEMDYEFKAYGSFLTGTTIGGPNGERIPILNGRIVGKKVSFTVVTGVVVVVHPQIPATIQQLNFDYTGEVSGDKFKLKFIVKDDKNNKGSFTVKREKEDS